MPRLLLIPGDNEPLRALHTVFAGEVDVQVFDSANDALWEIRHADTPPEVVVADLNLPGMSGFDLAEIIPNFGVPTRIVVWSRELDTAAVKQAESAGVHRFLNGPQLPETVRAVLLEALHAPPPAAPIEEPPAPAPPPAPVAPAPRVPEPPRERPPYTPQRPLRSRIEATTAASAPERPPFNPERPARTRTEPAAPPPAPPAPVPAATTPEPRRPASGRRGGSSFVFTAESLTPIRNRIGDLNLEVGSQCILLTDRAGMVMTEVGETRGIPTMILLPLLSTAFSTAGQISQVLREKDSSALYMQEGSHYDLYCFDVLQTYMLVLIFDRGVMASKIGTVWVFAKRAIRDIQEHLT